MLGVRQEEDSDLTYCNILSESMLVIESMFTVHPLQYDYVYKYYRYSMCLDCGLVQDQLCVCACVLTLHGDKLTNSSSPRLIQTESLPSGQKHTPFYHLSFR